MLMTSCRTETETVSRMQKAGPLDCCWRWRRRLSARVKAHGGRFEHFCGVFDVQCVKLMLRIFFQFGVFTF